MARIPDPSVKIRPGWCADMLEQACEAVDVKEESELLDWAIRRDGVSLLLPDGRKVKIPVGYPDEKEPAPESPAAEPPGEKPEKPAGRASTKKAE